MRFAVSSMFVTMVVCVSAEAQTLRGSPAFHRAYLDTTCSPCKDFWRFANGAWLDSVQIPPAATSWGRDDAIRARNDTIIRALLDSLAYAPSRYARSLADRNVGVFYRACMDSTRSPAELLKPLHAELRRLAALQSATDVSAAIGRLQRVGAQSLLWFFAGSDPDDPDRIAPVIRGLTGTTLSGRPWYLATDSMSAGVRERFVTMVAESFAAIGEAPETAQENARRVLALETVITRAQPQDSGGALGAHSLTELQRLAPRFDWRAFAGANGIGRPDLPPVVVRSGVLARMDTIMGAVSVEEWRAYLRWRYLLNVGQLVDPALGGPIGHFFRVMSGQQARRPQTSVCVTLTTWRLGNAVAQAYVARTFSADDRAMATALVERVRNAFRQRLQTLEWLTPATRQRALAKLDAMKLWIGYPDRWEGDQKLVLRDGPSTGQFLAIRRASLEYEFGTIGTQRNPELWIESNPAFVDLSYDAGVNALFISAAALQSPAFDARADFLTNLAGIGWGIGHELSHAFDSQGRWHSETGRRENWWAPENVSEYNRRAELVVRQYDAYIVIDSLRKSGRRTLAENLADIGGVAIGYLAFKNATEGLPEEIIAGFTREQRYFLALAQSFPRIATRSQQLRIDAASRDGHHVPQWRLNGALANLPAFARAFGCQDGDPMVLSPDRLGNIW